MVKLTDVKYDNINVYIEKNSRYPYPIACAVAA